MFVHVYTYAVGSLYFATLSHSHLMCIFAPFYIYIYIPISIHVRVCIYIYICIYVYIQSALEMLTRCDPESEVEILKSRFAAQFFL